MSRKRDPGSAATHTAVDSETCLLTVHEAAKLLGLKSRRTLYKWAYAGRIPSVKIGRLLRFRRSDVERMISEGHRPALTSASGKPLTVLPPVRYRG